MTTTTTSATEQPGNPWDLPHEQRPALFDPCTEIPIEAIEQGLGGPVEPVSEFTNQKPGELMSCGWASGGVDLSVLSTWKSRNEYQSDRTLEVVNAEQALAGRSGMRLIDAIGDPDRSCLHLFFTERGTAWIQVFLTNPYKEFHGQRHRNACEVIEQISRPIVAHIPKGNYR